MFLIKRQEKFCTTGRHAFYSFKVSQSAYDRFQTVPKGTAHSPSPMEPASSPE